MLLEGKTILIMGIRNKWSIAWGAAMSAYENGAKVIFTHHPTEKEDKILELIAEIPGAKSYPCDVATDEDIKNCFEKIKKVRKIGKKERVQEENIMIKVLFICHGNI